MIYGFIIDLQGFLGAAVRCTIWSSMSCFCFFNLSRDMFKSSILCTFFVELTGEEDKPSNFFSELEMVPAIKEHRLLGGLGK